MNVPAIIALLAGAYGIKSIIDGMKTVRDTNAILSSQNTQSGFQLISFTTSTTTNSTSNPSTITGVKNYAPSKAMIDMVSHFEGRSNTAYKDIAGNWTIGIGHLIKDNESNLIYETISDTKIDSLFRNDVQSAVRTVINNTPSNYSQNTLDALVSLAFNIGNGNFTNSTLLKNIKSGNIKAASENFLDWRFSGGKESLGLFRRRLAEQLMFNGQSWEAAKDQQLASAAFAAYKAAKSSSA